MKYLGAVVVVVSSLLLCTAARASSKYAGDYYAIATDDDPLKGSKLVAGINLTVHDDGSLTGRGAYTDLTPVTVTGKVKESGEVTLVQTSDGHKTTEKAQFDKNGKTFSFALPNGFYVIGKRFP